jgi:predicted LPLAT superfamily acyltransferase
MRLMVRIGLSAPAAVSWLILHGITTYFFIAAPAQRRASRAYLWRVLERRPGWLDQYRHIWTFACSLFDRVQLLAGDPKVFDVRVVYRDEVAPSLLDQPCLLLGAHLGNFELLRWLAGYHPALSVRPLMYREQDQTIDDVLRDLNPGVFDHILEIGPIDGLLAAREALEQGDSLALLADRCPPHTRGRTASLLGDSVQLPEGPFVLAEALNIPVVLCFGLRRGWRRYEVHLEAFDIEPRQGAGADRDERVATATQAFADRVGGYCRAAPYNWFNFYDYWNDLAVAGPDRSGDGVARGERRR